MEILLYFGVCLLTIASVYSIISIYSKKKIISVSKIMKRQSDIHEMIKDVIPKERLKKPEMIRQSTRNNQKNMIKVVFYNGKAYWIVDNVFYMADSFNGRVDESTATPIDPSNMSNKEVEIMMQILDDLTGGASSNDSSGSGH